MALQDIIGLRKVARLLAPSIFSGFLKVQIPLKTYNLTYLRDDVKEKVAFIFLSGFVTFKI